MIAKLKGGHAPSHGVFEQIEVGKKRENCKSDSRK